MTKKQIGKTQIMKVGKVSKNTLGGTNGPMIEDGYWRPIWNDDPTPERK